MVSGRGGLARRVILGILLCALISACAGGAYWYRSMVWRTELADARQAMASGRLAAAREQLARMAKQWTGDGEVLLLLGQCELERGHRDLALEAWSRVPASSVLYPRAALLRAQQSINAGQYAAAERILDDVLASPPADDDVRYDLERSRSLLYRREGRMEDVRRVLRASWCRSPGRTPDPANVLRELWLLDNSPMPVEAWEHRALDAADPDDDRVWLGRANVAILTGRFAEAGEWLGRALTRRPEDRAVWRAKLALARAAGDVPGVRDAALHLASDELDPVAVRSLRAWVAGALGQEEDERRELTALVDEEPGNSPALERLAVLAVRAGDRPASEDYRRRKAEIDRVHDRVRRLMLEADGASHARELSEMARTLGRAFDAGAWGLVAEAMGEPAGSSGAASATTSAGAAAHRNMPMFSPALVARAVALSAPYERPVGSPDRADLRLRLFELVFDLRWPAVSSRETASTLGNAGPRPVPAFTDDAQAAGLKFTFDSGQTVLHLLPETMSGGVGLLDFDGDGWLDVYCVQGGALIDRPPPGAGQPPPPGDRLFRNRGDGTFEDVTERSRIAAVAWGRGYGMGVAVGDYDNDGDPDVFVTRIDAYALYRNRGDGTFDDATEAAGLAGRRDYPSSAALADLDGDGDLDLYVCHYMMWDAANPVTCRNDRGDYFYCDPSKAQPAPDHAFRNDRGRFVDVTEAAGLSEQRGRGLGVVAADLDGDNRVDLYVANDGTANYLYRNLGGFKFQEVALESGAAGSASGGYQAGMGIGCGDLDGDGLPDLLVTNFYGEGTTYYHNLGQGLFDDRSGASGLVLATRYLLGFGIAMADVRNTGRLDVLVTNGHVNDNRPNFPYAMPCRLYENRPDGRLIDVSRQAGECWQVERVGRGLAVGDLDNDGRLDALVLAQNDPLAYFHNRGEAVGHHVTFRLEGTTSNRDGVGTRVVVTAGGRKQTAWRIGGGSYQSAGDPRLHFGLDAADRVQSIEVYWPSGRVDRLTDLPAGRGYLIREGESQPRPLAGFGRAAAATPAK